jgi:processive 1,2-diacylglycerol beta-glucosyltransferase
MDTLLGAFRDRGRGWADWRAQLQPLARPDAAREIAARVLEQVGAASGAIG